MHAVTERGKEAWYTLSVSFADSSPKGRAKAPAGAGSHPHKFQSFAEPTGRGAQWRQYVMPTFVTNCLQAQPGRGAQGQLYLVPNVRNALAAGLARQIPIYLTAEDFGQQKISASCAPLEYRQGVAQANTQTFSLRHFLYILFKFIPKGYHNCQLFIVNCQFTKSFFSPLILLGKDERCLK